MKRNIIKIFGIMLIVAYGLFCPEFAVSQQKQVSSTVSADTISNETALKIVNDYTFTDTTGHPVKLSDFRGQWLMVDVWYSGCGGCITANQGMRTVHDSLAKEGVLFLSISVDKSREKWMASVTTGVKKSKMNPWAGMYVPAVGTVVLYTSGSGHDNDFRETFVPKNVYPKLLLFAPQGNLISDNPPRPDLKPEDLINFIRHQKRAYDR
jgi:thiol-disulfide isomerase/thioredoxin